MCEGTHTLLHAFLVGVDDQIDPVLLCVGVAELDHLLELPSRIDVEQRKWKLGRIEGLARQVSHHAGILADAVEHDRVVEFRRNLTDDVDALRFQLAQMRQLLRGN